MRKLFALFMAAALTAQMLVPAWAEGFPVDPDSAGEPTEEIVYDEPTEDLDAVGIRTLPGRWQKRLFMRNP